MSPISSNWHYVIWYKNITVTTVSLILPFMFLGYWFSTTFKRIRQRSETMSCEETRHSTSLIRNAPTQSNAATTLNAGSAAAKGINNSE